MDTLKNVYNTSINYFSGDSEDNEYFKKLADSKIVQINNDLDGILSDLGRVNDTKIELPSIVVVGGQSSGKSSVLNGIITMNILPMGKEMVTRTPLCIQLTQSNSNKVQFGHYEDDRWTCTKTISFGDTEPTDIELNLIRREIERKTVEIAGPGKNISFRKITIKVFSPNVPNLTLVDLPGLTMVACTDKGQPKDIKDQIENMVSEYIGKEKSIILAVIPARADIEADMALGLVKKYDEFGKRTIGVLTKVDLMNEDTHVCNYLTQNISKDLQLKYGYFLVKNRSNRELKEITMKEGFEKELEYFEKHKYYGKLGDDLKGRLCTNNLRKSLSNILVENIKAHLPHIMKQINDLLMEVNKQLLGMGAALPLNANDKSSVLHLLIAEFCKKFVSALEERNSTVNIGRKIKDVFIGFKGDIKTMNPFNEKDCPDKYINDAMKNCEGNHMSCLLPPIEVLEHCLTDYNKKPIHVLKAPAVMCVDSVVEQLKQLIDELLLEDNFARFPKLVAEIKLCINTAILDKYVQLTLERIDDIIGQEESYIWTDEKVFMDKWSSLLYSDDNKVAKLDANCIRELLQVYFITVIHTVQNCVPKAIMHNLIRNMSNNISSILFKKIAHVKNEHLLEESSEIAIKRKQYTEYKTKLMAAKKLIHQ